jgi:hypothetical protein
MFFAMNGAKTHVKGSNSKIEFNYYTTLAVTKTNNI